MTAHQPRDLGPRTQNPRCMSRSTLRPLREQGALRCKRRTRQVHPHLVKVRQIPTLRPHKAPSALRCKRYTYHCRPLQVHLVPTLRPHEAQSALWCKRCTWSVYPHLLEVRQVLILRLHKAPSALRCKRYTYHHRPLQAHHIPALHLHEAQEAPQHKRYTYHRHLLQVCQIMLRSAIPPCLPHCRAYRGPVCRSLPRLCTRRSFSSFLIVLRAGLFHHCVTCYG